MNRKEVEKSLRLISRAWGKKQKGYAFFPYIDREKQRLSGTRRGGFTEGPAFMWPAQREEIVNHILSTQEYDQYWSASLFEYPIRREDTAMDEHALWADLDRVDPSALEDYPPTVAWETSPGSYQALWIAGSGDFQGASWSGNENQRMTYYTGADMGGWFTTKLLRIPGTENHKPEYAKDGKYPKGKVLWDNGPTYHPGDFGELPPIDGVSGQLTDALESEIEGVDRHAALAKVRIKLTKRARDMLSAREVSGDRSSQLWYLIRALADVGCSVAEIVAIVRETVWNKFRDRGDELKRLILEASKAIAQRSEETSQKLEEEDIDREAPQRLAFLLKNIKRPLYVVDGILTEGSCGFIAGEPKCYKSWVGLDLALSVASGAPFLGEFRVVNPGPVLYIQEEDPPTIIKQRSGKIWLGKGTDKFELVPSETHTEVLWLPPEKQPEFDPDINAYIQKGVTISDEAWQLWLDETLQEGMDGKPYRVLLIDTLMMTAGDVEETRAQEMTTKIFKPLKTLARKHNVSICVIHHMGKADRPRSGQRMLGSVANHAWSEDSIYLSRSGADDIRMEVESKTAPGGLYRMSNVANKAWEPHIAPWRPDEEPVKVEARGNSGTSHTRRVSSAAEKPERNGVLLKLLTEAGGTGLTTAQVAESLGISRSAAHKKLVRQLEANTIERSGLDNGSNLWIKA